ncbi:MAG: ribosome recycling factor [Candidatus Andersenbacteria bacterium]|nr:ribosome recycling factor [Candidatus Andersenbacteria bacterium]
MTLEAAYDQFNQAKTEAEAWFREEMVTLRTGRISPELVARVPVEHYGSLTPLQGVASIAKSDARTLTITPWDRHAIVPVEKALTAAQLGAQPMVDGKVVRLVFPTMTQEARGQTVKRLHQLAEEARVRLRLGRDTALKHMREAKESGALTEDDFYTGRQKLDELIDTANGEIAQLIQGKEKDIRSL